LFRAIFGHLFVFSVTLLSVLGVALLAGDLLAIFLGYLVTRFLGNLVADFLGFVEALLSGNNRSDRLLNILALADRNWTSNRFVDSGTLFLSNIVYGTDLT